jgi:hypothetical protein
MTIDVEALRKPTPHGNFDVGWNAALDAVARLVPEEPWDTMTHERAAKLARLAPAEDDPMFGTPADGRHPDHACGQDPCPHIPVPAEDEGRLPCTCRPFFDAHVMGHPDCPRGRAEDEGRLREWLDKRETVPWSRGFSDEFKRGYEAAFEEFRAALTATPEPGDTP